MELGRRAARGRFISLGAAALFGLAAVAIAVFLDTTEVRADETGRSRAGVSAQGSPEQELAEKYNPILRITNQSRPCSKTGNVYNPAPVEIVLDQPGVVLREIPSREIVVEQPTTEDIAGVGPDYDIDWPGNPRRPGCVYERDYLRLTENTEPTVYVHIATEDGVDGIAVQYWYNYYYNDFANKHEGDWEMVQIMFDEAKTVEEALEQEPTRTAYSGHAGGETANWTDDKLEKVGDQPVVYVTTGAHAAHYSEGTFIGVAKRGQVFGCDPTIGPHRSVEPVVIMLPDEAPTEGEFAWLSFAGLWGEESGPLFSGIRGPAVRERWDEPFTWAAGLRDFSDKIPDSILGIDPVGLICAVVNTGSDIMLFYGEYPFAVIGGALLLAASLGLILGYGAPSWLTGRSAKPTRIDLEAETIVGEPGFLRRERRLRSLTRASLKVYLKYWPLWMLIGLVMIPVSLLVMFLEQLLGLEWLVDLVNSTAIEPVSELIGMTVGALIGATVVAAAVFAALRELDAGRPATPGPVFRRAIERLPAVAFETVSQGLVIGVLGLTVLGVPLAVNRAIAWAMAGPAVVIEDTTALGSLSRSSQLVKGSWLRVAGTVVLIALFIGLPGPLIAFGFLVFTSPPVIQAVYPILSMLYVLVLFPLGFIASGLLYGDLCAVEQKRKQMADETDSDS
jgi:hypothetical protein